MRRMTIAILLLLGLVGVIMLWIYSKLKVGAIPTTPGTGTIPAAAQTRKPVTKDMAIKDVYESRSHISTHLVTHDALHALPIPTHLSGRSHEGTGR